ncbi:MAG: ABC transporter permease, partial [Pseudomonadota bacterium]|nr:ABC transporter permease [Pseudomonadota bacterium]
MNNVALIISKRLGLGVLTMFMVSIIIFLAVNMLPGDFAQALLGQSATPEAVEAIRRDLGLNKPIHTRYFDWLVGALQFDFGTSFAKANFSSYAGTSSTANFGTVADQIAPRFANTLFLAAVTACIAVP